MRSMHPLILLSMVVVWSIIHTCHAATTPLWSLGLDDDSPNEFSAPNYSTNAAPGSATVHDDDFYFAGTYAAPIGVVAASEPASRCNNQLSSGDALIRFRFPLSAAQALSTARLRFTAKLIWPGWWNTALNQSGVGPGTHEITVRLNGGVAGTATLTGAGTVIIHAVAPAVSFVSGANVLEFRRSGGTANGWIHIDSVQAEIDPTALRDQDTDGLPEWWERDQGLSDTFADAGHDPDNDSSTNAQEMARGTAARNADTDGDGLKDGFETISNPLVRDTDGDGLLDGVEVAMQPGLNPALVDTDGDGAPDGWEVRVGTDPTVAGSVPAAFPHAIGLHFVCDNFPSSAIGSREPAGMVPQMFWNNTRALASWSNTAGSKADVEAPSSGVLVRSDGTSTGVNVSWGMEYMWGNAATGSADLRLFNGYLTASGTPATVTFSNIPFTTYDVLVYVGVNYEHSPGVVRLNSNAATDRYFLSTTAAAPDRLWIEPTGSTAARPWPGNVIRYRGVTGTTCAIQLSRIGDGNVGLHGVQIVNAAADTDGDGMPDVWEIQHRLPWGVAGAAADRDGDGLSDHGEYLRGTNPNVRDTDGDGLSDLVETGTGTWVSVTNTGSNALVADTDGDGLADGVEVAFLPASMNPNLADSDGDGRSDADESRAGTDPLASNAANDTMPVVTTAPRTFTWQIDNVQLRWDHERGLLSGDEALCYFNVINTANPGSTALLAGLRLSHGRVVHLFHSSRIGAFSAAGNANSDIWHSDWSGTPADLRGALGFSGAGRYDLSDRLRFRVSGTSTGARSAWNITFEIRNLDTNTVVRTVSFNGCTLATNVHGNTATWSDYDGVANRLSMDLLPGVTLLRRATALESTPAFSAYLDTDEDGMPDAWEDANGLNKLSAADATSDTDGDGLSALREYLVGTNPAARDTDGDLVADGLEVQRGSNPLLATSRPPFSRGAPAGAVGEDLNGNGLPDAWEAYHGRYDLTAGGDADGDGMTNAEEAAAGTDPFSPHSRLWSQLRPAGTQSQIAWPMLPMKRHDILESLNFASWAPMVGTPSVAGTEYRMALPGGPGSRFYRVRVADLDTDADGVSDWTEGTILGSNPASAHSLRTSLPIDVNGDGIAESTLTGDYVALLETLQNAGGQSTSTGGTGAAGITRAQASRFLMQATFGPTLDEIDRVTSMGYSAWIADQLTRPPTFHSDYIRSIRADVRGPRVATTYSYNLDDSNLFGNNLRTAFTRAAVQGQDLLRQRVAFALSQILVTSRRDANLADQVLGMSNYYDLMVQHAFGNYGELLEKVAMHPCMGRYLSHIGNQKARPDINQYPDENFAREVMQLFSIGLWELNPDGTRQTQGNGQHIPTYSNTEITQMARVFTGLWFGGHGWGDGGWSDADYARPMSLHASRHDFGEKTLLRGVVLPSRVPSDENAARDISDAIRHLIDHPNTAPFISKQLIQFLVTDNPSPAFVARIAAVFANNGSGVRGDLAATVRAILLDVDARDPAVPENDAAFGRLKEPVIRTMALGRAFGLKEIPDLVWWDWGDFYDASRQEPSYSPSVFNFYRPDYRAPGLLTQVDVAGPVFQITDSYSAIAFPNTLWSLLQNGFRVWAVADNPLNLAAEAALAGTPDLLLDRLDLLFCAGRMSAATRAVIVAAISQIPADQPGDRARVGAYLALVSPEGAVMR